MIKVSILVPIYNVEKYLEECLKSLINQTLQDIEIICLNDGSTDSSTFIIDKFAKIDPRIRVIHKKNTGYGDTMNLGMQEAKGEYIGIVESDDFIETNMYQELYGIAKEYDLDFVKSNYWEYTDNEKTLQKGLNYCDCNKVFSQYENLNKFETPKSIWSAIYKRIFLIENNIQFLPTPGASYQDTSFWFKVYITAKRGYFTPKAYLNYRCDNVNSSVKSKGKVYCICDEMEECRNYLLNFSESDVNYFYSYMLQVKLSVYAWNIERLSSELKEEFTMRMLEELKEEIENNSEKISEDISKKIVYIISNSEEHIRLNSEETARFSDIIYNLEDNLLNNEKIYIYGAGKKGKAVRELLIRKNVVSDLQFVTTSDNQNNSKSIFSEDLDTSCPILIAIADYVEKFKAYMNAKERGFQEIILVDLTVSELENM